MKLCATVLNKVLLVALEALTSVKPLQGLSLLTKRMCVFVGVMVVCHRIVKSA